MQFILEVVPTAAGYILSSFNIWRSPFQFVPSQKAKSVDNFVVVVFKFPSYPFEVD